MRRASAGSITVLALIAASCATRWNGPSVAPGPGRPEASAWSARPKHPSPLLGLVRDQPELEDLTLYLRARDAARSREPLAALRHVARLGERHPDSIWIGSARLLAGQLRRQADDLEGAAGWLAAAREAFPKGSERWVTASLALGDVQYLRGDDVAALELAQAVRGAKPGGVAAKRARRLTERLRRRHPALWDEPATRLADAELLLGEGDAARAAVEAESIAVGSTVPEERARALWVRARAERALGQRAAAEATCLEVARISETLGPKAIAAAARWRWNADDDAGALRLYRRLRTRFPTAPEATEALYAIGRIDQEAGRYDDAFDAYDRVAREQRGGPLAGESRWRAGWVRYLAGDLPAAASYFTTVGVDASPSARAASAYWAARIHAMLQDPTADTQLGAVIEQHPTSYYAALAAERLGRGDPGPAPVLPPPTPAFPDDLGGPHAARARVLAGLGLFRLARRELDAVDGDAAPAALAQAYTAVNAPGAGILAARGAGADVDDDTRRFLYPLGFWPVVEVEAARHGLDPLLVAALIRQESLFLPEAVSPADAQGLMQLLPRTARAVAGEAGVSAGDAAALHVVSTNVRLGTTLLRRLLDRYDGSRAKALAAYNAGEDAVAKWERRYGPRPEDEFVELISYRETRDYVKLVLQNLQMYRRLYAASPLATSPGSPPKAPFDMMTTTSPGALVSSR